MKIITKFPFNQYDGYTVINPEGRRNVCLVHKITKKRTTISYARYLMSVHKKRKLKKKQQVDHINGDKTDDRIENLQILSVRANNIKRFVQTGTTRKMVEMKCPGCEDDFIKPLNGTHIQKGASFSVCSKECLHIFLKKGLSKLEMIEIGKKQIIRHFRK